MAKTITIDDEVRGILTDWCEMDATSVTLKRQLDRPTYDKVNKVLVAAGGKWNPKKSAHLFKTDPREALLPALQAGGIESRQQKYQIFYTPAEVAEQMAQLAQICVGDCVLEPSAGDGALAYEARTLGANVICVEIRPEAVGNLRREKFFVIEADFLALDPLRLPQFDVILMNPPFSGGQEISHITRAADSYLLPGGRLVSVMSNAVQFRSDRKYTTFRDWLDINGKSWELIDLPRGTFKESGTGVATALLRWTKKG